MLLFSQYALMSQAAKDFIEVSMFVQYTQQGDYRVVTEL